MGLVLVGAMAAGLSYIASPYSGAAKDLIINNETGFLMDFEDNIQTARKVNELLSNESILKKIGVNGQKYVLENFHLKNSGVEFIKAIDYATKD